jgi:hypothetical protein
MKKFFLIFYGILSIYTIIFTISTIYRTTGDYVNVFKVDKGKYTLEITEGKGFQIELERITEDTFFYEHYSDYKDVEFGCGKLELAGYNEEKEYFYGKSEYDIPKYGDKELRFGILKKGDKYIDSGKLYEDEMSEKEREEGHSILRKQCTGYFILNLKTGEYQSELSEKELEKILSEKGIKNEMERTKAFLESNGESIRNYGYHYAWNWFHIRNLWDN